jgi:predicted metal-binding membrane protein
VATVPAAETYLPYAIAAVLLAAGLFQFTPLKRACLHVCQHPFVFMMGHWHSGYSGAFRMAAEHAAYCVGCCWALMVVMVAAGAMSLPWVLVIGIVVFVEKLLPQGARAARVTGGALILLALVVAIQPGLAQVLRGMPMQS